MTDSKYRVAPCPAATDGAPFGSGHLSFVIEPEGLYDLGSTALTWRNWQTRTAQDRMGQPVEVRVLS